MYEPGVGLWTDESNNNPKDGINLESYGQVTKKYRIFLVRHVGWDSYPKEIFIN